MATEAVKFSSDITVEYLKHLGDDSDPADCAWVSTRGAWGKKPASDAHTRRLLDTLITKRHGVPFEHNILRVRVHGPIKMFREWHRHRIGWSYSEESGRFKQLTPLFYVPPPERPMVEAPDFKPMTPQFVPASPEVYSQVCNCLCRGYFAAWAEYEKMLELGVDKGLARDTLGVGLYSSMIATCNVRSLMHLIELRTNDPTALRPSKPLWEMDRAARQLEDIFEKLWPVAHELWHANRRMAP